MQGVGGEWVIGKGCDARKVVIWIADHLFLIAFQTFV